VEEYNPGVPRDLKRFYGSGDLHFITFSCHQRRPLLTAKRRDLVLRALEQTRTQYELVVAGYVVMPEHVHLLLSEPRKQNLSVAIKALKQGVSRRSLGSARKQTDEARRHFWQPRFYDFNVWTEKKRIEKLRYMHRNPVKRGLVGLPQEWRWSSFRHYAYDERGIVLVNAEFAPQWARAASG
jgi:putative transposase